MFCRILKKTRGDYLIICDSFYDPAVKHSRQRCVKSCGYIEDLKELYEDPVAHFREEAKRMTQERENPETKQKATATFTITLDEPIVERTSLLPVNGTELTNVSSEPYFNHYWNLGYVVLKTLYLDLELDKFWSRNTRDRKIEFSVDRIFRLLVFSRVLFPGSKRYTYDNRKMFFEPMDDFTLDDIYHSLDIIALNKEKLQDWLFKTSAKICERDVSIAYFDCTNFYFDISHPDVDLLDSEGNTVNENGEPCSPSYRKRGAEKNKRPDPIVNMGLLIDRNGLPIGYDLFPGNESEKVHMRPILRRFRNKFPEGRVIIVADRGLNTSDNIYYINGTNTEDNNQRDGYLYGQSVRGADQEFKDWVLSGGYTVTRIPLQDGEEPTDSEDVKTDSKGKKYIIFTHKHRIQKKKLNVNVTVNGVRKKKTVVVDQRQMVYYSAKYARRQKIQRDAMIQRAKDLIANPKKYDRVTASGAASYIVNISFDKNTGEVVEGKSLFLDEEKIKEEEKFDGYYSIVTSELEMDDLQMRKVYRGLATIEESFKITKSDFTSRPVFVRTNDHIDAHFATCFVALLLIRLLQAKLGKKYSIKKILNSLRKYSCVCIENNIYKTTYLDNVLLDCEDIFKLSLNVHYRTRQTLQRLLRY